jgi:uncharacterized protein YecT (DUF1311 family)
MTRLFAAALLAVSLADRTSPAQHVNEKDSPCAGVAVTSDLTSCLWKAKEIADAKLNTVYQKIREKLQADDSQRLVAAECSWIQYRDANCRAERDLYRGGTATPPACMACIEAMTRARTRELEVTYSVTLK